MTESARLSCTDPQAMLEFLKGRASDRKLKLLAVAGCRKSNLVADDERACEAMRVAEQIADGNVYASDNRMSRRRVPCLASVSGLATLARALPAGGAANYPEIRNAAGAMQQAIQVPEPCARDGPRRPATSLFGYLHKPGGRDFLRTATRNEKRGNTLDPGSKMTAAAASIG